MSVGVVGLGKLGLPLAALLASSDELVIGVDKSVVRVEEISARKLKTFEPGLYELLDLVEPNLRITSSFESLAECSTIYLIVPTPSLEDGSFSNDYLLTAISAIGNVWAGSILRRLLVIVSTVMPGACEEILIPALRSACGEELGSRLQLVYSPEFIALGSVIKNLQFPDMLLIGSTAPWAADQHENTIRKFMKKPAPTMNLNLAEAELAKLLVNTFVTMKISFANYIAELAEVHVSVDAHKVAHAIGMDERIGIKYLRPGLGYGGPCFPRDTFALRSSAKAKGISAELADATEVINSRQPGLATQRILEKCQSSQVIGVFGLTYKPGSEICEQSQAIIVASELVRFGKTVLAYDPTVVDRPEMLDQRVRLVMSREELATAEFLVIATPWVGFEDLLELGIPSAEIY